MLAWWSNAWLSCNIAQQMIGIEPASEPGDSLPVPWFFPFRK